MEDSWTSAAWELLLPAVRAPRRQRRRQLETALRDAIRSGRVAAGTRLPASRALADDLCVSRGLVTTVYDQLRAEGYLVGRPGAGTYAAPGLAPPPPGIRRRGTGNPGAGDAETDAEVHTGTGKRLRDKRSRGSRGGDAGTGAGPGVSPATGKRDRSGTARGVAGTDAGAVDRLRDNGNRGCGSSHGETAAGPEFPTGTVRGRDTANREPGTAGFGAGTGMDAANHGLGTAGHEAEAEAVAVDRLRDTGNLSAAGEAAARVDFRPGRADPRLFPRAAWANLYRQVVTGVPDRALSYGDPRGVPELREALAGLLARRRGVRTGAERIVVCGGVAQAVSLLCRVLAASGHGAMAVEDPGPPEHAMLARTNGLRPVGVGVGARGPDLSGVAARAALVTPAHQFPTGIAYPPETRAALVRWASTVDGLLVEDDYDGDFRYDRAPVGAIQGLAPDRVAYAGSVSKSLASGLRIGWLVVPAALLDAVVDLKRADDLCGPVLEQRTFAAFVTTGRYDAHLRRCQRTYRARRDVLVAAVRRYLPAARITGIAAGLHAVLVLPGGDEATLTAAARAAGVTVLPLRRFGSGPSPGFVLGYAHLTPDDVTAAVATLAAAWRPLLPRV